MEKKGKTVFLYSDYFDATTATWRVLSSSKDLFLELKFFYWARTGFLRKNEEDIYKGIEKIAFTKTTRPRSISVLFLFFEYQIWLLQNLIKEKPKLIVAFTFYTVFPSLIYKIFFNRKSKVVYDPRDYVAVSYHVIKPIEFTLRLLDSLACRLANFVIFPDTQFERYYGLFKLNRNKYLVVPNSTSDQLGLISDIDIFKKFNIPNDKKLIPIIGYFSETRGRKMFFEVIDRCSSHFHFVVAGDLRDPIDLDFFNNRNNVSLLGKVSYLDACAIMRRSIFVPLIYDPLTINNKYAYPTKFYDSLMLGVPVVVSTGQVDIWEVTRIEDLGLGIEYNDAEQFLKVMDDFQNGLVVFDSERLRAIFNTRYNFDLFTEKLRNTYLKFL